MTTPLGDLRDVSLRDAWTHEAFDFTPWLAQNLDRLGSVLGIRMELGAMEHPVTKWSTLTSVDTYT